MHVGEVGPNKVEKRTGIEAKEKRTKTRALRNSVFNRNIGGIRTLNRDELSRGNIQTKTEKSHKCRNETGDD